jgi:hypothetical protein
MFGIAPKPEVPLISLIFVPNSLVLQQIWKWFEAFNAEIHALDQQTGRGNTSGSPVWLWSRNNYQKLLRKKQL